MEDLKTNYKDDVLDTSANQLRKYQMITNDDGTVSFVDVTTYTQIGDNFGAKDINDTNAAINEVNGKLKNNEWKLLKSQTTYGSANVIELPANYIELYICSKRTSDNLYMAGTVIPRIAIASNINYGYGNDINGYSLKASWNFNANTLTPFKLCVNGVDVTNQYTYEVYYR